MQCELWLVHTVDTNKTFSRLDCLVLSVSAVWTELATSQDCRPQKNSKLSMFSFFAVLSSLEMRCELSFVSSRPSFQFAARFMIWCRQWIVNHDWQSAYHNHVWELHGDSVGFSNYLTMQPTCCSTFWARSRHRSSDVTQLSHVHQCWTVNCDIIFGNRVTTCLQMRSNRTRDKLFSLKYTEDYWELLETVNNLVHTANTVSMSAVWTRHYVNENDNVQKRKNKQFINKN